MSYPNQRIIYITRSSLNSKKYFKIGAEQLKKAACDLGGNAFKFYIYLCGNKDNYRLELSSKDFIEWSSTSDSTYDRAFKELTEKDYLIKSPDIKNVYLFVEESKSYSERHPEDKIKVSDKEEIKKLFKNVT